MQMFQDASLKCPDYPAAGCGTRLPRIAFPPAERHWRMRDGRRPSLESANLMALMAETSASLGIIISPFVYETAVEQGNELIDASEYKMVEALSKEYRSTAWLRLVD
jgi:hypothetical protein